MTKSEFMLTLASETSFMTPRERRQVLAYFNHTLPDTQETQLSPHEELRKYLNKSKVTSKIPQPLFIAALLALSPFILEIAIFVMALVVILSVLAIILLFLIPVSGITLWLDGVQIIFRSISQAVILADKLWQIGIGFVSFAAGAAIMVLVFRLYSKLIPWILGKLSNLYTKIKERTK